MKCVIVVFEFRGRCWPIARILLAYFWFQVDRKQDSELMSGACLCLKKFHRSAAQKEICEVGAT